MYGIDCFAENLCALKGLVLLKVINFTSNSLYELHNPCLPFE